MNHQASSATITFTLDGLLIRTVAEQGTLQSEDRIYLRNRPQMEEVLTLMDETHVYDNPGRQPWQVINATYKSAKMPESCFVSMPIAEFMERGRPETLPVKVTLTYDS